MNTSWIAEKKVGKDNNEKIADQKAKIYVVAIIHLLDVRPVSRRLKSVMETLTSPTEKKKSTSTIETHCTHCLGQQVCSSAYD